MNRFLLTDKNILVTGASSGIGRQVSIAVSEMGGSVIAVGRNIERLNETMGQLKGNSHVSIIADLAMEEDRENLIAQIPKINGVVHSAGLMKTVPMKFVTEKALREISLINYDVPVLLMQSLLKKKLLLPGSSVVFISSIIVHHNAIGHGIYAGSKGALSAVVKTFALELATQKTRANCLLPGMIRTQMSGEVEDTVGSDKIAEHERAYPLGFGCTADVANAVIFLLSDASRWITGTNMIIDGGLTC